MGQGEELSVLVASSIKKISISHLHFSKYHPEFDSLLTKKVPQTALAAAFGTFVNFLIARYAFGFFVCEQIFLIFFIGTICFEVQKPNASCRASVSSLLV